MFQTMASLDPGMLWPEPVRNLNLKQFSSASLIVLYEPAACTIASSRCLGIMPHDIPAAVNTLIQPCERSPRLWNFTLTQLRFVGKMAANVVFPAFVGNAALRTRSGSRNVQ